MPPRNESAAKRAVWNKDAQRIQDESLAAFLSNRNLEIPNGLKRTTGDGTDEQERNLRQRGIEQDALAVDDGTVSDIFYLITVTG